MFYLLHFALAQELVAHPRHEVRSSFPRLLREKSDPRSMKLKKDGKPSVALVITTVSVSALGIALLLWQLGVFGGGERSACNADEHARCGDHGTCLWRNNSATCECSTGYGGSSCGEREGCTNEETRVCELAIGISEANGAICEWKGGAAACKCATGYRGAKCDEQYDCNDMQAFRCNRWGHAHDRKKKTFCEWDVERAKARCDCFNHEDLAIKEWCERVPLETK